MNKEVNRTKVDLEAYANQVKLKKDHENNLICWRKDYNGKSYKWHHIRTRVIQSLRVHHFDPFQVGISKFIKWNK